MESFKKTIIVYLLSIFAFIFLLVCIKGCSVDEEESTGFNDYARITDVDYKAVLVDEYNQGSKAIITEKLTYEIHAASKDNLFWELWRDLPEDYIDGLKVDYKVNYVKQINDDGTKTKYVESPKLYWDDSDYTSSIYGPGKWYHSPGPYNEYARQYECVLFYVDGLYREKVTFEIQYEMNNAAFRYADVSELYLSMYSEETIKYLESFKGQILISNKDMPSNGNYLAHTYGTNSNTFDFTESDTKNPGYYTFSFELDKNDLKFKNYNQYLEFSLLAFNEDKHIFTNYAPSNYYSNDVYLEEALEEIKEYDNLPLKAKINKILIFIVSILISSLILKNTKNKDKNIKNKHNIYTPSTNIQYFREIPSDLDPHFAATLVFSKQRKKVDIGDTYSALMLNLVRKGYIELVKIDNNKNWDFNNISINVLYTPSLHSNNFTNNYIQNEYYDLDDLEPYKAHKINQNTTLENTTLKNSTNTSFNNVQEQLITPNINSTFTFETNKYNKNGKKLEELSTNEEAYFNLVVKYSYGSSISLQNFQNQIATDYDNTDTFVTSTEKSIVDIGISQRYFQKANYNELKNSLNTTANTYIIFAILILTIGNICIGNTRLDLAFGALFILGSTLLISAIYYKKIANNYVLLTQYGEDEHSKWLGLYNFLNSETLMKERTIIELPLWEKYLVYATAFGISEKVTKALEIRCPNTYESNMLNNEYYRSKSFKTNNRSFGRSTRHASTTSRTSRYSSGGSYYGGGGRGGGGGGGGH